LYKEVTRKKRAEGRGEMEGIEQKRARKNEGKNTRKEVGLLVH
jgi:hypothetical protein